MTHGEDSTRERIKQVALELFASQGYGRTSLREIAERMEFTKAALYYHFRNKDDLLAELLNPLLDDLQQLAEQTSGPLEGPVREEWLERYLAVFLRHRRLAPLIMGDLSVLRHPQIGGRVRASQERLSALLAEPGADVVDRMRAFNALGVMRAVFVFYEADEALLRAELLAEARAILAVSTEVRP